jgi:hypothetical protein
LNTTFTWDPGNNRLASVNRGLGTVYTLAARQTQGLYLSPTLPPWLARTSPS